MRITKEMKVAEIFESYPQTRPIFQKFGFGALMNATLRMTFGKIASVETGCKIHGVGLDDFLYALNASLNEEARAPLTESPKIKKTEDPEIEKILKMKTNELLTNYPDTREVFTKYFGKGCFSCPSFGKEDIRFACSMHNTNPLTFAQDCIQRMKRNEAVESVTAIHDDDTINDIIGKYPSTLKIFHKHGLDSCCGGNHSIKKAATAHGIQTADLKKELLNQIRSRF